MRMIEGVGRHLEHTVVAGDPPLRQENAQNVEDVNSALLGQGSLVTRLAVVGQGRGKRRSVTRGVPGSDQCIADLGSPSSDPALVVPAALAQVYQRVAQVEEDGEQL